METISVVLDKDMENFHLNKCTICQKSGSLVFTENDCIRIIEAVKIRNDEVYGRLMSSSLDADFKYHIDNKCYKNYVYKKALQRIKVRFFVDDQALARVTNSVWHNILLPKGLN